jgi:hypothetical protein
LTIAWLTAFCALAVLGGAFSVAVLGGQKGPRVSLPIERLETMARAPAPRREERLPAPESPEALAANDAEDAKDNLPYPEEFDYASIRDQPISEEDIVITIAGSGAPAMSAAEASLSSFSSTRIAEPDPDLLRATPFGAFPKIAPDGRKALQVYARPHDNSGERPQIAIVVGGLGIHAGLTERAIDELPPEVSLAFAPYAKDLEFWSAKAREAGHEVLIELPMEGYGADPAALGPAGLLSGRSAQENLQRLEWIMTRFSGYFAATNYLGAKFSADRAALAPVLEKLREAGVAYIDDTGAARSAGAGAPIVKVDRIIPAAPDDAGRIAVRRELAALEKIAEREGAALGKTYAYAATLEEVAAWMNALEEKGFAPAPASAVLPSAAAAR